MVAVGKLRAVVCQPKVVRASGLEVRNGRLWTHVDTLAAFLDSTSQRLTSLDTDPHSQLPHIARC